MSSEDSEHGGFNDDADTEMSAYNFDDECDEGDSDDDDDGDDDDGDDDDDHNHITEFDEDKACRALTRLVCTDDLPPQIIESPGFQNFMRTLNPFVQFGTIETMKRDCLKFYAEERVKVLQVLKKLDGQINLSVEILRSPANHAYMCLTAHFIDDTWKVKKWVLRFHVLWHDVLAESIRKAILHWDIEDKISTIILKSASCNDETVEMVKDHIQKKKKFQLNGQLFHVYCCADLFSLMVQDAFDEISTTIVKVRELINWVKHLPQWDDTISRLKEALESQAKGNFSSQDVVDNCDVPSADEWKKVEGICKLVEVIHGVAKLLFETRHPTASIFLGNLRELSVTLTREASTSDSFIHAVVEKMVQKLDKYWEDMFLVLAIATVMDPRCKMKYIEFLCSQINGSDNNSRASNVLEAIHTLYNDCPTHFLDKEDSNSSHSEEETSDYEYEDLPSKKRKAEEVPSGLEEGCTNPNDSSRHFDGYHQFVQSTSGQPKSELDLYLEEPVLPWDQDFKLLKWWRAASPKYPNLSRMARDFLSIPFSVVTSSDVYYTEERKVDRKLISSGQPLMNVLMCTRSWSQKH